MYKPTWQISKLELAKYCKIFSSTENKNLKTRYILVCTCVQQLKAQNRVFNVHFQLFADLCV